MVLWGAAKMASSILGRRATRADEQRGHGHAHRHLGFPAARYRPDHLGLVFEHDRLAFREFNSRVNRLANALLAAGLAKGDKIATVLPNCTEQLEAYWAAAITVR